MRGKHGAEYLSIWWFFVLAVVFAGVIVAVSRFGYAYDVSSLDASVLASRVSDCIVKDGEIVFDISNLKTLNILGLCGINFRQGKDYFVGIEVYNLSGCTNVQGKNTCYLASQPLYVSSQNQRIDLKDRCINLIGIKATYMPECSYKDMLAVKDGKNFNVRVIGGTYENKIGVVGQ